MQGPIWDGATARVKRSGAPTCSASPILLFDNLSLSHLQFASALRERNRTFSDNYQLHTQIICGVRCNRSRSVLQRSTRRPVIENKEWPRECSLHQQQRQWYLKWNWVCLLLVCTCMPLRIVIVVVTFVVLIRWCWGQTWQLLVSRPKGKQTHTYDRRWHYTK